MRRQPRSLRNGAVSALKPKKIEAVIASAGGTVGLPQVPREQERMRQYAAASLAAYRETQVARRALKRLAQGNEVVRRQGKNAVRRSCGVGVARGGRRG